MFFYFFALVSYVGFAIYTVYMFIQALRFFTTRTTKRETQKKSYAFFSSFLIRSTNAHFTVTVEKKKKKRRGECRRPKYLVPRQQHTIQRSSLVTVVGAESRTGITERQWTELGMTGGAINWSSIPSDNRSQ